MSPERCASPKNLARVKPSSRFFATRVTNISRRSSIVTGSLRIISIQAFHWNQFSRTRSEVMNFVATGLWPVHLQVLSHIRETAHRAVATDVSVTKPGLFLIFQGAVKRSASDLYNRG